MLGAYICRQCSLRLSRRARTLRNPQWQPRATFLSFNGKKPQVEAEAPDAESRPQRQQEASQDGREDGPNISYVPMGQSPPKVSVGRYSGLVQDDSGRGTQASTYLGLIEDVEEAANESESRTGYAVAIQQAIKRRRIDAAWRLFEKNYPSRDSEALTNPSAADVELLMDGKVFKNLLGHITMAFCRGDSNVAITPTAALFEYEKLGIAHPECWENRTLGLLTHQVIQAVNGTNDQHGRDLPSLLFELLSVWRLFFQCRGRNGTTLDSISTEWHLPATDSNPEMYSTKEFNDRLQEYHPKHIGKPVLSFCAAYLYSISDALNSVESLQQQSAPLLQFFELLLAGSSVRSPLVHTNKSQAFLELPGEVQEQIKQEIKDAPRNALSSLGSKGMSGGSEPAAEDAATRQEDLYLKRIARAIESRDSADILLRIWNEVGKTYTLQEQKIAIPPRIYNAFLTGFLVLRDATRTVEIWNHMIANGVKPDMKSWVALLDGCTKARDLNGLNAMWDRLLGTGLEPDNYAWTARINGLISLRQAQLGLAALDDMGKRWLSAETVIKTPQTHGKNRKGPKKLPKGSQIVNNCTKPSVEVVNGAITALIQDIPVHSRVGNTITTVGKILGWAVHFGIKPDVRTYNALIRLYTRAGDTATVYKLLRQMEKEGMPGDQATHTMLITAAFDNKTLDNLSVSEQTARILGFFDNMEASGLTPNLFVYSTAIDRSLKQYSNVAAVGAIMERMRARNQSPGAAVYTSLISHYFRQNPPAIAAVESLVTDIFNNHRLDTDRILFDRVLEGYAAHDEVNRMMGVLMRLTAQGRLPGWSALIAVVEALAKTGELDRARAVVRDVERGEGLAKGGMMKNRVLMVRFFAMAREYGLTAQQQRRGGFSNEEQTRYMPREEDGSDDASASGEHASRTTEHEFDAGRSAHEQEAQSPAVEKEQEEDVHGFLVDEPELQYRRAGRP